MSILTPNIKNIIFDFGGVLINLDYDATYKAFISLGVHNLMKLLSKSEQTKLFDDFEEGTISPADFRNELRKASNVDLTDEQFDWAWNQILLDIPQERLEKVMELKKQYRVFLLSNTNKIHYDHYLVDLQELNGFQSFEDIFEKAYFSHDVNMRKPNAEIFEFVLSDVEINASETLFIDDTERHILSAQKLGIQTHHLKDDEDICQLFH